MNTRIRRALDIYLGMLIVFAVANVIWFSGPLSLMAIIVSVPGLIFLIRARRQIAARNDS